MGVWMKERRSMKAVVLMHGHSLPLHGKGEKWSATFSSAEVRCLKMTMMPI